MRSQVEELGLSTSGYTNDDVEKVELVDYGRYSCYVAVMRDGKKFRMRRVTTVLSTLGGSKTDNLINWAVKETISAYQDELEPGRALNDLQLKALHEFAEKARFRTRDEAADLGTRAHELIERFIHTGDWCVDLDREDPRVKNCLLLFAEWFQGRQLGLVDTELYVYDVKFAVAGTLDFLCYDAEGHLFVWDWKTSKGIYDTYLLQVAAYVGLLVAMGYPKPAGCAILRIGKEDAGFQVYEFAKDEWLTHYQAFLRLNALYEWQKMAAKRLEASRALWWEQEKARRAELDQLLAGEDPFALRGDS